jgi:chorismate-pyruvate lyase
MPMFFLMDDIVADALLGPSLGELYRLIGASVEPPAHENVVESAMPQPYRRLLVHPHHMTVTVEEHYGGPVNVRVLDRRRDGDNYTRKILLALAASGQVVQFGIVRIRLDLCTEAVRDAILAEQTPLGRILIEHDVLRRIEPTAYLHLQADAELSGFFGLTKPTDLWGRLALIHCDGQPAIELLEVLAPIL